MAENPSLTTIRESLAINYNMIYQLTGVLVAYVVSTTLKNGVFNKVDLEARAEEVLIKVKDLNEKGYLQRRPEILDETRTTVSHTRNFLARINLNE